MTGDCAGGRCAKGDASADNAEENGSEGTNGCTFSVVFVSFVDNLNIFRNFNSTDAIHLSSGDANSASIGGETGLDPSGTDEVRGATGRGECVPQEICER